MGVLGFEPRTSALSELRSSQLSYTPVCGQTKKPNPKGLALSSHGVRIELQHPLLFARDSLIIDRPSDDQKQPAIQEAGYRRFCNYRSAFLPVNPKRRNLFGRAAKTQRGPDWAVDRSLLIGSFGDRRFRDGATRKRISRNPTERRAPWPAFEPSSRHFPAPQEVQATAVRVGRYRPATAAVKLSLESSAALLGGSRLPIMEYNRVRPAVKDRN